MRPQAQISFGARVVGDVSLGSAVCIGSHAKICDSKLGDNVIISERCGITHSVLCGDNTLEEECGLYGSKLGRFSYAGKGTRLINADIGSFCSISSEVSCGYDNVRHPTDCISTHPAFCAVGKGPDFSLRAGKTALPEGRRILIGSDVLIGYRALIREGVKIGHGAVVGAGAIVTRDIPDYAIVVGVPAKVIRYRFPNETIARLLQLRWWDWDESRLSAARRFLARNDPEAFFAWAHETSGKPLRL